MSAAFSFCTSRFFRDFSTHFLASNACEPGRISVDGHGTIARKMKLRHLSGLFCDLMVFQFCLSNGNVTSRLALSIRVRLRDSHLGRQAILWGSGC